MFEIKIDIPALDRIADSVDNFIAAVEGRNNAKAAEVSDKPKPAAKKAAAKKAAVKKEEPVTEPPATPSVKVEDLKAKAEKLIELADIPTLRNALNAAGLDPKDTITKTDPSNYEAIDAKLDEALELASAV